MAFQLPNLFKQTKEKLLDQPLFQVPGFGFTPKIESPSIKEGSQQLMKGFFASPEELGKQIKTPQEKPLFEAVGMTTGLISGGRGSTIKQIPKLKPLIQKVASTIDPRIFAKSIPRGSIGKILDVMKTNIPEYARGNIQRHQVEAVKSTLLGGGKINPIVVDEGGNVLDGAHRLVALKELGISSIPTVIQKANTPSYRFGKTLRNL